MTKYVSYIRVSTAKQGRSGLGLAAQKSLIDAFVGVADELVGEYVEVQSGKCDVRVELWRAIALAKKHGAKILIAKLDRFSRKVSFIAGIMEQGIGLAVAEMPHATDFQLHIFAALAQEERRLISDRTRRALAEAKKRGVKLGKHGEQLAALNRRQADARAARLAPTILPLIYAGASYSSIARHLNELGVPTASGRRFFPQTAKLLVRRVNDISLTQDALPVN